VALAFSRFDGESQPSHLPLTQAVETVEKVGGIQHIITGFYKAEEPYGEIQTMQ
jgi:hypothetical protein